MIFGFPGSCKDHHLILLLQVSLYQDQLRWIGWDWCPWILDFNVIGNPARYSPWLEVVQRRPVSFSFTARVSSLVEYCRPEMLFSLLTGRFRWMILERSIFWSSRTLGLARGVVGGDLRKDELAPYPDDDDVDDWGFADVPADSHVEVCVSLHWAFNATCELFHFTSVAVPEHASRAPLWLCRF